MKLRENINEKLNRKRKNKGGSRTLDNERDGETGKKEKNKTKGRGEQKD